MSGWLILHGGVCAGLVGAGAVLALNLAVIPRLRADRGREEGEDPKVSVLVPARNEARNIERCVASLLAQDYPHFEVRVLDDHSEDETAELVRRLGLREENGGLLRGKALPEGWVGKNWACHQLAEAASGDFLMFTDADTEHEPGVLRALVDTARRHGADLVSAWPRQRVGHWAERLVVSLLPFVGALFYPHWVLWVLERKPEWRARVPGPWRRGLGAANGQVMFFSREGYAVVGGHAGLRGHLVEDVALGRAMAERMGEGRWWVNVDSGGMVRCRMYRSFGEVWEGFSKNARAAFEEKWGMFLGVGVAQVLVWILPFVWVGIPGPHRGWAVAEVAMILAMRSVVVVRFGGSWWSVWLHPLAYGLGVLIALNSWRRSAGKGVSWKGRVYAVRNV
ncbi:MAG: hypothetical protein RLZZ142_1782 [Verrucomicrobiota bacterium]